MGTVQVQPINGLVTERSEIESPEAAVQNLLRAIGEDPHRSGLQDTPTRFVKALREMTSGYQEDPGDVLGTVFKESYAGPVEVRDIPFWSLCEHHLLPFHGTVDVHYVPNGHVVGLSKLSRVVQTFARRLQLQERLTRQIADAIEEHLDARSVRITVRGAHSCMAARGVKTPATMVTRAERGAIEATVHATAD